MLTNQRREGDRVPSNGTPLKVRITLVRAAGRHSPDSSGSITRKGRGRGPARKILIVRQSQNAIPRLQ